MTTKEAGPIAEPCFVVNRSSLFGMGSQFTRVGAWLERKEQQRRLSSVIHKHNFIRYSFINFTRYGQINERCLCIIGSTSCPLGGNLQTD